MPDSCHRGEDALLRSTIAARLRPIVYLGNSSAGDFILLSLTTRNGDVLLSLWAINASGQAERKIERIVLADPVRARPRSNAAHIRPLFEWNLASALHRNDFNEELQKLESVGSLSGDRFWQRLRHERSASPKSSTRPLQDEEYQQVKRQLEARRASIALPAEPGQHGVHLFASDHSFYERCSLYIVEAGQRRARFVTDRCAGPESEWPVVLTGMSPPIYRVNRLLKETQRLHINAENSPEYLRFFCTQLHAELGAFTIVDTIEDLDWRYLTFGVRQALEPLLWPVIRLYGEPDGGAFVLAALVSYGRDLSLALFKVVVKGERLPSGETVFGYTRMITDAPLLADLPVYPHAHDPQRDTAFEVLG